MNLPPSNYRASAPVGSALIPIATVILVVIVRDVDNPTATREIAFSLLLVLTTAVTEEARLASGRLT